MIAAKIVFARFLGTRNKFRYGRLVAYLKGRKVTFTKMGSSDVTSLLPIFVTDVVSRGIIAPNRQVQAFQGATVRSLPE